MTGYNVPCAYCTTWNALAFRGDTVGGGNRSGGDYRTAVRNHDY